LEDPSLKKITRALVSVSNKTGLVEFAQALARHQIEIISTGGTARRLREHGLTVKDVAELTGFPEMLDGRVKTLHPKVHGGILGIRHDEQHQTQMQAHGILPIDLVVVNLYPFRETVARPEVTLEEAIENIDIGGPTMIRSAAKNHHDVAVVVEPADYAMVSALLDTHDGALPQVIRYQLALAAFRHTARYDKEIARFLWSRQAGNLDLALGDPTRHDQELPAEIELELKKRMPLRYGENPHQRAALYQLAGSAEKGVATAEQLQGKELSYNNLLDADAAWELVSELRRDLLRGARGRSEPGQIELAHVCAIIKHTNPCGVGLGRTALEAFTRAKATDPVSAFGGIIAFSQTVDEEAAQIIAEMFAEVIIAPEFTMEARRALAAKKNLRVLRLGEPVEEGGSRVAEAMELRRISGGVLVQERDRELLDEEKFQIVSGRKPTPAEMRALRLAWVIAKHVKSNAIVYAREGQLVGVGAGQMSRVDSVKFGALKAQLPLKGTVLGSDAFFPFRDGIDEAATHGITAIIQPGGSVRDQEVIEAANEHKLAMVFTGLRHFKH
jgi:phosphoribosylaminoimidazolecarboxamide formyltransferase/IMP cyclohydrolase